MSYNNKKTEEIHRLLKELILPLKKYLELTDNSDSDSHDVLPKLLYPLNDYLRINKPQKLYKIMSLKENGKEKIESIKNDLLYSSRADRLNDPYDCLLYFNESKLKESIKKQMSVKNIRKTCEFDNYTLEELYGVSSTESLLMILAHKRNQIIKRVESYFPDVTEVLKKSTFISAFTEVVDSPIMWSHYGENHKGFALEYQFEHFFYEIEEYLDTDLTPNHVGWRALLPVIYSDARADATELAEWYCLCKHYVDESLTDLNNAALVYHLPDMLLKLKLSLHKDYRWSYEKEWRRVYSRLWPNEDKHECSFYPNVKATAIYLGTKISKENKDELLDIAKNKNIAIYEMYIDHNSDEYKMSYKDYDS